MKAKGQQVEEIQVVSTIETIQRSDTQSIRVMVVQVRGEKKVAIQKYWRKSSEEPWLPGKGFHIDFEETQLVGSALEKALEEIE